jgi:two-component system sensor histidine kinase BaeS
VLAGLGTIVLAAVRARSTTESEVRGESVQLAAGLADLDRLAAPTAAAAVRRQTIVRAVARALKVDDVSIMSFGPAGRTTDQPPAGVSLEDLDVAKLLSGATVSGNNGNLVYAASASAVPTGHLVAVVTRKADAGVRAAARWFLVAAVIAVLVSGVVAFVLSRRIVKPVRDADAAAHRIAAGELSTRLPEPPASADDELADLVRSINAMAASLERSKALEQQFLLSVSHDLRTPLTSIQGYAEAITDGATSDPAWAASIIGSEAKRLDRLVRDLLDLAKLQARSFRLEMRPVDLAAVAAATVDGFRPDAQVAGVTVRLDAPTAVLVNGDGDRLAQVVANLVENALKYARTEIALDVRADGGRAVLLVDDDGRGIASEDLPHVFERLYVARHDPARRESGSGLGLAITRELVEAMGGEVAAEVAPRGGARMAVRLPGLVGAPAAGAPLAPPRTV